jgi:hypothetical protein
MRKFLWTIPVVVITVLGSTAAKADNIVTAGGYVTAIDNITLDGALYDVAFTSTDVLPDDPFTSLDFSDLSADVALPIIADLPVNTMVLDGSADRFYVAYSPGPGLIVNNWECIAYKNAVCSTSGYIASSAEMPVINSVPEGVYAEFTPLAVPTPEPGTATLMLSGLGAITMLMWKRRQEANRRPQSI